MPYDRGFFLSIYKKSRAHCLQYSLPRQEEILGILNDYRDRCSNADTTQAASAYQMQTVGALIPFLSNDVRLDLEPESLHVHLLQCFIVGSAGPRQLALFCTTHDPRYIVDLLENTELMKEMVVNGGAKKALFGQAYKIYDELMELIDEDDASFSDCHRRLAMGVALELAEPITIFGTKDKTVDPRKRFLHYVTAHKNGELDPSFPYFTVWEYRHIVNSDATDEELQWGRDQLKRYRPDLLNPGQSNMKYCKEVKTDVACCRPDWGDGQKTYVKLISCGGKCGPRAWMGRFLCKAFGVPSWGVRQPSHAALARWTPDVGWATCLGGSMSVSHWEGRCGDDFKSEAHARHYQKDIEKYFMKVTLLQCMATAYQEKTIAGDIKIMDPTSLWHTLARAQILDWSIKAEKTEGCFRRDPKPGEDPEDCAIRSYLSRTDKPTDDNQIKILEGEVRVPACAFSGKQNVAEHLCFEGGGQVHFQKGSSGSIQYELPSSLPTHPYELSFKICSLHLEQESDQFSVSINGSNKCEIPVIYTIGEWVYTDPVEIELGGGDALKIVRKSKKGSFWGLTLRELVLKARTN